MYQESQWIRILFLLSDTSAWLAAQQKDLFKQLQLPGAKQLFRNNYYLSAPAFAHIVERHYHQMVRHPLAAKFTIPIPDILHWIKEAATQNVQLLPTTGNYYRSLNTQTNIGYDCNGAPATVITVITTPAGLIQTAFPGIIGWQQ
jgi:hypothetical protein